MPHKRGFPPQLALAALGDGTGEHGVALHHAAVFRRTVVGMLELAIGVVEQGLQLLVEGGDKGQRRGAVVV